MTWNWSVATSPDATYSGNFSRLNDVWRPVAFGIVPSEHPKVAGDSNFNEFLVCVMAESAGRSASRGFATLGIWLTGGAAATFALAIANAEAVATFVSTRGLKTLLWSCAACTLLGIVQQLMAIMSEAGRDATTLMDEVAKRHNLPMATTAGKLPEPIATPFTKAFPKHLQRLISRIVDQDRYTQSRALLRRAEGQRIVCYMQVGACFIGMVGPILLAVMQ